MKYIKSYEGVQNRPKVGDYVICTDLTSITDRGLDFLKTNIGQIASYNKGTDNPYKVIFNTPSINFEFYPIDDNTKCFRWFKKEEILIYNKDKEIVEAKLNANKYNL